ncbi:MAG TPA: hypothetical protein VMW53_07355 [archaeon]|nr:hypothetical protein [archaeon]
MSQFKRPIPPDIPQWIEFMCYGVALFILGVGMLAVILLVVAFRIIF